MIVLKNFMLLLLQKDSWKTELKEFSSKNGYDLNRNGDSGPLLLDVLEGFLKFENLSQARGPGRRSQEIESSSSTESRNTRRPSSSTVAGGLPPLGRPVPVSHSSGRSLFHIHLIGEQAPPCLVTGKTSIVGDMIMMKM